MDSRSHSAGHRQQPIAGRSSKDEVYNDSCLHIEHQRYFFAVKGTPMALTRTEFRVISHLVQSIDRIVAIQDLWDYAWSPGKSFNRKSIHVFVSRVRRKLAPFGLRIDSVVGVGYILSRMLFRWKGRA
jgi:DNA-binding response OmpR family regulator